MIATGAGRELLERDESLSALSEVLATVRSDANGRLLWVGGEAGVGKTALLRRFCEMQDRPVRILWGACEPLLTPRPLGPFLDVAEDVGGQFGELVAGAARPHRVAAALLEELRGRRPTVLVLEDLHWTDEATLDVLTLLAGRIRSTPALALASYRDDELDRAPALRLVLGELARWPDRLKLEPLSATAVAALADEHDVDGVNLHARTGGNPFFVTEVLAAGGERLPDTMRDAVRARSARLSGPARKLLEAVAVVPGPVEPWLLRALGGELVEQLDECLASGMLRAAGTAVGFRHELARLAVEEAISPDRRLALNREALSAIASSDDPDFARAAHHADASGDADGVLKWAPRAAERAAAAGAHREAAAQYERALRFSHGRSPGDRGALLERRAEECAVSAQIDEAIAAQREAVICHRRGGDALREGDALRMLSRLLYTAHRFSEGETAGLAAVELLERLEAGHELAIAYCNIAQRRANDERLLEAAAWAGRALELAQRLDDTEALVHALSDIGFLEAVAGEQRGRAKLESALELAQQHGLEEHAARVFTSFVAAAVRLRRLEEGDRYLKAGLEYCDERGLDTWRLYLLACRALLELDGGRWDDAADAAAVVMHDAHSVRSARSWALTALGLIRARRGDPEAAAALTEAWRLAESSEELHLIGPNAAARAELSWLAGDHSGVVEATDEPLALAVDRGVPWIAGEMAYWRWRAGLRDQLPSELVAEPYRLSIDGHWERAAELWREIGCPYEQSLALADADDEGVLRQAHDQLQALGARPAAAIVARRLRERGARGVPRGPRPTTRDNPAGLTARELEVLALVSDGLRNAEIARRLVVTEKTVDKHVSAILRKLDVQTRGEAAAESVRRGLT
jgi:DNA-binding CsgD family transcriptional regulator